jgi:hypothetical protein
MRLYHVTPARNVLSIRQNGICLRYARCTPALIWLSTRSYLERRMAHIRERHSTEDVAVFYVNVGRETVLRRFPGTWTRQQDIPPERILGLLVGGGASLGRIVE